MSICKSDFPKWLSVIFFFQFFVFLFISYKSDDSSLIYWSIGLFLFGLILFFLKLTVNYSEDYIEYKFSIFSKKHIDSKEIEKIEFIKVSEFMGYGISISKKYGLAYIMYTDEAVCITKKDGKKITLSICDSSNFKNTIKIQSDEKVIS